MIYRETRDTKSGEVLEALYPRKHGVSVEVANRLLASFTDFVVVIHYDDGAHELAPTSVKSADLEDKDVKDEDCTSTIAGGKRVFWFRPRVAVVFPCLSARKCRDMARRWPRGQRVPGTWPA